MNDTGELASVGRLYKTSEVAKIFGVTPYTVRQWLKDGTIQGTRLGDGPKARWRVSESEVRRFANARYGSGE